MVKTILIIVSGFPCTGKTTLAKRISKELDLPFISRDNIKELLFNTLGIKDREWSKHLGISSYKIMYYFLETLLSKKISLIIESNFKWEYDRKTFLEFKKKYDFTPFEILCKTDSEILFERFKQRSKSWKKHPSHVDHLNLDELKEILKKVEYNSLNLGTLVYNIDTTDFKKIDYSKLFKTINSF